jgi:centromere/kinetochore protein ZW10
MSDDASLVRTAANEHGGERRFGVGLGTGDETGASRRETLFDCAPCTVSAAADALTEHVDRVLESACELGPHAHRASANLAAAAADCLDLFRACVTATRAERLRSIHTSSVVFYNDCHHLANRFCASVYARGPALKRQIGREPALLWPVEPLRALGDATRSDANERALEELHAALDVADGFLRSGEAQVKANIAKSIARARHVIHRAGTVSMYALPHPLGTQDAAELALHYARRVALEVLSIEDISVEESEALTELLGAAFATDGLVGAKGDTTASRALVDAVGTEWFKARELGLMLSAPLRDITADWERGRSRALGFSSEELRGLIGALFSETSLRAECLARIQ